MQPTTKTSEALRNIVKQHPTGWIQVNSISQTLHEKGFGLLLFVFAFPLILPTIPGLSTVLSLPLLFFSGQMALGKKDVLLPRKLALKSISAEALDKTVRRVVPWIEKMERYIKPRGERLFTPLMERLIGLFSLVLAGCIALPLSVFTNSIPALGISIMALAMMQRDSKCLLIGFIVGLVGLLISVVLVYGIAIGLLYASQNVVG